MLYVTGLLLSLRIYYRTYLSRVPKCIIRETNKNLYDSNDGLRSALASAAKRRVGRGRVGRVLADYFLTVIQFNEDSSIFNPLSSCLPRMKSPLAGCGPSDRAPWTTAGTSLRLRWTSRISGFNLRACCFLGAGQRSTPAKQPTVTWLAGLTGTWTVGFLSPWTWRAATTTARTAATPTKRCITATRTSRRMRRSEVMPAATRIG